MAYRGLPFKQRFLLTLLFTLALGACGGGGSSDPGFIGGGDGGGSEPEESDYTIELSLSNSDGEPTSNITTVDPGRLDVLVTEVLGGPLANVLVTASTTIGILEPASGTALTDAEGRATLFITAGTELGAGTITVETDINIDTTVSAELNFQVGEAELSIGRLNNAGNFVLGEIGAGATNLPAAGSTVLEVAVVDADGDLVTNPVQVAFSSGCASLSPPAATITANATTVNGIATSTYTAAGCVGDDVVTAAILGTSSNSASVTLNVAGSDVNSISFFGAEPATLALKGTGGSGREETSTVTFQVFDATGSPVQGVLMTFELSTTIGGLALTNDTATTDDGGFANVIVQAGSVATSVRVEASIDVDGISLTTVSDRLVVTTGLPDQNSFSLSMERHNVPGGDFDGTTNILTIRMADKFNNSVPDGTVAVFETEYGAVASNCETVDGVCSVTWTSQLPRQPLLNPDLVATINNRTCSTNGSVGVPCPADLGPIRGRRSTVLVTTLGEESFDDQNGNGRWDVGELFEDLPEAFRDNNENGVYDGATSCALDDSAVPDTEEGRECASGLEETFVDFNENGMYDGPNGIYNGLLCPLELEALGECTRELVSVRQSGTILLSNTVDQRMVLLDSSLNVSSTSITAPGTWYVAIADRYNVLPAAGALVSIRPDTTCPVDSSQSVTVVSTSATGALLVPLVISDRPNNTEPGLGTISITLENEVGGDPFELLISCTDPAG